MTQENKDWSRDIAALYCVNKQRIVEEDCNMECQSGKCLCMDHEQLFLLQCLMETEMVININADGVMMEEKETLADTYCYKQCASVKKLINCHGYSVKNLAYKQTEKTKTDFQRKGQRSAGYYGCRLCVFRSDQYQTETATHYMSIP